MGQLDNKKVVILVGSGNRAKILAVKNAFIPLIPYLNYFKQNITSSSENVIRVENKNKDDFFLYITISTEKNLEVNDTEIQINSSHSNDGDNSSCNLMHEMILIEFVGVSVESGISDQPFTDEETKLGALNRAQNALSSLMSGEKNNLNSENNHILFSVGLEGGVQKQFRVLQINQMNETNNQLEIKSKTNENPKHNLDQFELECYAWMCIIAVSHDTNNFSAIKSDTNEKHISYARTASFMLPRKIKELMIEQNLELGHADDLIFKRTDSKSKDGVVGLLTKGVIDRSLYYSHALSLALIPFLCHEVPDLY